MAAKSPTDEDSSEEDDEKQDIEQLTEAIDKLKTADEKKEDRRNTSTIILEIHRLS